MNPQKQQSLLTITIACLAVALALAWGWRLMTPSTRLTLTGGREAAKGAIMDDERRLRAFATLARILRLGDDVDQAVRIIEQATTDGSEVSAGARHLASQLRPRLVAAGFPEAIIDARQRSIVIGLPATVMFSGNPAILTTAGRKALQEVAASVSAFGDDYELSVGAHGNSNPSGNPWLTTAVEAAAVLAELDRQGIRRGGMVASGYGDTKPLYPARRPDGSFDKSGVQRNHRIEITLRMSKIGPG